MNRFHIYVHGEGCPVVDMTSGEWVGLREPLYTVWIKVATPEWWEVPTPEWEEDVLDWPLAQSTNKAEVILEMKRFIAGAKAALEELESS